MNPSAMVVITMTAGLIVQTLSVLGIAWRGGRFLGRVDVTMTSLTQEVQKLRESHDEHAKLIAEQSRFLERISANLKALDDRVSREFKRR